jgi:hypothetical protein
MRKRLHELRDAGHTAIVNCDHSVRAIAAQSGNAFFSAADRASISRTPSLA